MFGGGCCIAGDAAGTDVSGEVAVGVGNDGGAYFGNCARRSSCKNEQL